MRHQTLEDVDAMQELVDALPVAVFVKDAESKFQLMNKACEEQWGLRLVELKGTDASQIFPPEQMKWFLAKDKEAFASGCQIDFEEPIWNAALKQNRIGHTFKKPVYDESGKPQYLICITIDITERKLAENALRETEKRLLAELAHRSRIEHSIRHIAAAVSFDAGEVFLQHLVAELANVFGADYAFVGMLDDLQPQTINTLAVYAHGKIVDNISYSLLHTPCANVVSKQTCVYSEQVSTLFPKDQLLQDMGVESYIGSPLFDAAGKSLGLIVVLAVKPMTDPLMVVEILEIFAARAAAELQRLRDEQQLRIAATAFDTQESLMITDANSVILRVNHAFVQETGYTSEEAVGQTPRLFSSGRHDEDFYNAMWASIHRTGSWQGEIWDRRKNGEVYPKLLTISAVKGKDGVVTNYVGSHIDITERKASENKIHHLAFYDPLTGLPNRRLLIDRLGQALISCIRGGRQGAFLFIDLDNFKTLNDTLGHNIGDLLLQQVALRLEACIREGDTVARLGGDEFVVMLEDLSGQAIEAAEQTGGIGAKIIAALNLPYQLDANEYRSTPSIGITLFGNSHAATEEIIKQADIAMYQAKNAGRNTLRFFDPEMQAAVTARVDLEKCLRSAVREQQFVLYFQAQVDGDGRLTGAEALVRWQHPQRGLILPDDFIPLTEETGIILPLGNWVLESACTQLAIWSARADAVDLTLAVNVSVKQIRQADFVEQVLTILDRTGADPCKLKLELTESLLMDSMEDTIAKMTALKARGIGFALDDFGTGFSSLSYLKRLPLEKLKIDRSFVMDVLIDPNDAVIAKTIVSLAQSLGLAVIAEGVETEEQRDFLAGNGCHAYQGYLYSRPLPLDEFERYVHRNRSAPDESA